MVLQLLVLKNDKQRMLRKGIRFLWLLWHDLFREDSSKECLFF
jgi:hypothetical protein